MAVTPPPSMTPAPTPAPQRSDRTTFSSRVDAFVTWLITAVSEFSAAMSNVSANATDAANSANSAASSLAAAVSAAGVSLWVANTAYATGVSKYSPADFRTYRSRAAVNSAVDPSLDPTNWAPISFGEFPILHVRNQQPSGTGAAGDSIAATSTSVRAFNTIVANTIGGASLASNNVTLPAGTYRCQISCPSYNTGSNKASLYDTTAAATVLIGTSENAAASTGQVSTSCIRGRFTIASSHIFSVKHYTAAGGGGGLATSSGLVEVYSEAIFEKVA
jgi:hypothetical protein